MGKVKSDLDSLKDPANRAGEALGGSFTEARGGLMLTEEAIGVHLPRHLNTLIAQIPGVGAAFATMLPIVGVFAAVAIIAKLVEKHEELIKKIHETAEATDDLAIKQQDQTKSIELANLILDDQIAKLEGKPEHNRLREALLESNIAVDKLANSFAQDFQKIDASLMEAGTLTSRFWEGLKGGTNMGSLVSGVQPVQDALAKLQAAMLGINTARLKLAEAAPGTAAWADSTKALASSYHDLQLEGVKALSVVKTYTPGNIELISQITQATIGATNATKDLGLEAEATGKRTKIASLENIAAHNAESDEWFKHIQEEDKANNRSIEERIKGDARFRVEHLTARGVSPDA